MTSTNFSPFWTYVQRWLGIALLAATGLTAVFLACEGVLRLGLGTPPPGFFRGSACPGLYYEHVPGAREFYTPVPQGHGASQTVGRVPWTRINHWGFRGPDFTRNSLAGKRVVLCLGDSCTFGVRVGEESLFTTQAAQALERLHPGRFAVINAGVGGYNLWDYRAVFEHLVPSLNPRYVVIGLCLNDNVAWTLSDKIEFALENNFWFFYNARRLWEPPLQRWRAWRSGGLDKIPVKIDPESVSAVVRYAGALGNPRYQALLADILRCLDDLPGWERALPLLYEMKDVCDRKGIRLLVLVFPNQIQLTEGYRDPEPQRFLAGRLSEHGIDFVDLRPVFARAEAAHQSGFLDRRDTVHFNDFGHRMIAEELQRWILSGEGSPSASALKSRNRL